ncbi:MAG TPA: hypothetical protein VGH19_15615 [Verrucomicrobiae bacterium]
MRNALGIYALIAAGMMVVFVKDFWDKPVWVTVAILLFGHGVTGVMQSFREISPAEKKAAEVFAQQYPQLENGGMTVQAEEKDRVIILVYHWEKGGLPSKPCALKMFSVAKDLSAVEELAWEPGSPYWFGRK